MLTPKKIVSFVALGCVVVVGGFLHDLMFAGIPYQDPPPEVLARYNFHSMVAGCLYMAGFGIIFLSMILFFARIILKRFRNGES